MYVILLAFMLHTVLLVELNTKNIKITFLKNSIIFCVNIKDPLNVSLTFAALLISYVLLYAEMSAFYYGCTYKLMK